LTVSDQDLSTTDIEGSLEILGESMPISVEELRIKNFDLSINSIFATTMEFAAPRT
jgi:hypothetical protein